MPPRQLETASGTTGTVVPPVPGHQLFPRERFLPGHAAHGIQVDAFSAIRTLTRNGLRGDHPSLPPTRFWPAWTVQIRGLGRYSDSDLIGTVRRCQATRQDARAQSPGLARTTSMVGCSPTCWIGFGRPVHSPPCGDWTHLSITPSWPPQCDGNEFQL